MRKKNAKAFHEFQTATKIPVPVMDWKTGKKSVRKMIYKFRCRALAEKGNLQEGMENALGCIQSHFEKPVKIDPKKGTIAGTKIKAVFKYWEEYRPSVKEMGCNPLHKWMTVCKDEKGRKYALTHTFSQPDQELEDEEAKARDSKHPLFAPEEIHPLPKNVITKVGERIVLENTKPIPKTALPQVITETFFPTEDSVNICEAFFLSGEEVFNIAFPKWKSKKGQSGYTCLERSFKDSHKVLYRLLNYLGEIHVKKGEFYKGGLMTLALRKTGAAVNFYFYKKELAASLWVPANLCKVTPRKAHGGIIVTCGVPGSGNKKRPKAPKEIVDAFKQLVKILETTTDIYPGNNFRV